MARVWLGCFTLLLISVCGLLLLDSPASDRVSRVGVIDEAPTQVMGASVVDYSAQETGKNSHLATVNDMAVQSKGEGESVASIIYRPLGGLRVEGEDLWEEDYTAAMVVSVTSQICSPDSECPEPPEPLQLETAHRPTACVEPCSHSPALSFDDDIDVVVRSATIVEPHIPDSNADAADSDSLVVIVRQEVAPFDEI